MRNPKISIVTICFNAESTIENTILSVINQDYDNKEYIIIDGKSNDRTNVIISQHINKIDFYCSDFDKGVYDAMNKGALAATGDYIIFMNSGDTFFSKDTLSSVINKIGEASPDVIFGDAVYKHEWGLTLGIGKPYTKDNLIMPFCHQSSFVKTNLMKEHKFNIEFKIQGDNDFMYRLFKMGKVFTHVPIIISKYLSGGISNNILQVYKEGAKIMGISGRKYYLKYLKALIKDRIYRSVPSIVMKKYEINKSKRTGRLIKLF